MLDPDWEPTTSDCYWVPLATSVQQHKEKALEHIVAALQVYCSTFLSILLIDLEFKS